MVFNIDDFLAKSQQAQASDIHINCGKLPSIRINGDIYKISAQTIEKEDIKEILLKTLPEEYKKDISSIKDLDYMYELKGVSRYRVNFCRDIFGGKFTFRIVPYCVKSLDDLSLPKFLKEFTKLNNGIVFVTGATGSGKSTTLASMIEIINQTRKEHIITIEDPVEFVYEDKKSIITQRSVGIDVLDFQAGIKYALRQDPDVILVGEIRDRNTLISAIEAAETGHLVFSTLHTNGTIASLNRLVGFIEESAQAEFMKRISTCIRGIIHQQLVPSVNNGSLVPALEILTFTSTVIDYAKDGKFNDIYHLMQKSNQSNLVSMNAYLYRLFEKQIISREIALEYSLEKIEMEQMLRGMLRGHLGEESIL